MQSLYFLSKFLLVNGRFELRDHLLSHLRANQSYFAMLVAYIHIINCSGLFLSSLVPYMTCMRTVGSYTILLRFLHLTSTSH